MYSTRRNAVLHQRGVEDEGLPVCRENMVYAFHDINFLLWCVTLPTMPVKICNQLGSETRAAPEAGLPCRHRIA